MASQASIHEELAVFVGQFYNDPLGFIRVAYPWGKPGPLEGYEGPDKWQVEFLEGISAELQTRAFDGAKPVMPLRRAVSSGHGIGKSTMAAWLVDWIMSTRPDARGTVTANTFTQLETKTWAAIKHWTGLCITAPWFTTSEHRMYHIDHKDTWFCAPASCKDENSEAFAGQHAATSTSFYIFDEDSAVSDNVHEVSEGGLTDGEPMVFRFGNPTRNSGDFHRVCFGTGRDRWKPTVVDSRESAFTNKAQLQEWIDEYGEDSDFVRVRVRGLPPRASELQFIDQDRIWEAQRRRMPAVFDDEPLIAGVDVSDGGSAWNVVRFRRGADGRSLKPVRVPGQAVRNDRSVFLAKLAEILSIEHEGRKVEAMFIDSGFGAPYVERLHGMGFKNVHEVRFGSASLDRHQSNMRAYMWNKMKEWLSRGAIQADDNRLESDLIGPGYTMNRKDEVVLESKEKMAKRGIASPDDADALALTFASDIGRPKKPKRRGSQLTESFAWT